MTAEQPQGNPGKGQALEPAAVPGTPVTDDAQLLRREIEQTREQLGDTVSQLAARADVKAIARARAGALTWQLKDGTGRLRTRVAENASDARRRRDALAAAAATLIVSYLAFRWWDRR